MNKAARTIALSLVVLLGSVAAAQNLEESRERDWSGAWVILRIETYSKCGEKYYDNDVSGSRVTSRGGHRFDPGELAKIDNVRLKKERVDLMATLAVSRLVPREDGPFTLYDERTCKVELRVARGPEGVDRVLADVAERFDSRAAAEESAPWNRRKVEPFPESYDTTVARHAVWKAKQINLRVRDRIDQATYNAIEATHRIRDNPSFLEGLAAGVDVLIDLSGAECEKLLDNTYPVAVQRKPSGRSTGDEHNKAWRNGYENGQRLVYNLELARQLSGCFVEIPESP